MFPARYFPRRAFAPRYFPKVGAVVTGAGGSGGIARPVAAPRRRRASVPAPVHALALAPPAPHLPLCVPAASATAERKRRRRAPVPKAPVPAVVVPPVPALTSSALAEVAGVGLAWRAFPAAQASAGVVAVCGLAPLATGWLERRARIRRRRELEDAVLMFGGEGGAW